MKDGLQRMLEFLAFCNDKNVHYALSQHAPDSLMATLTLVGMRIEVSFTVQGVEYSIFEGHEDVLVDEAELRALIERNAL